MLQFNAILQTRDTARGLIVNMSDVLFDTAKFSLRPEAREKLAKVAGIVSGHPGLRLDVEGHTDNVGGDDYNQKLSEERGSAVRDYLIAAGNGANSVSSKGFGKTQPVASNETAAGRQQNRRVELVISGEIIGSSFGKAGLQPLGSKVISPPRLIHKYPASYLSGPSSASHPKTGKRLAFHRLASRRKSMVGAVRPGIVINFQTGGPVRTLVSGNPPRGH